MLRHSIPYTFACVAWEPVSDISYESLDGNGRHYRYLRGVKPLPQASQSHRFYISINMLDIEPF